MMNNEKPTRKSGALQSAGRTATTEERLVEELTRKHYHQAKLIARVDPRGCLEQCRTVEALRPDHPDIYRVKGEAYLALNKPKIALQEYRKALNIAPHNTDAMWGMGMSLYLHSRDKKGFYWMTRAIQQGHRGKMPRWMAGRSTLCWGMVGLLGQGWLGEVTDWLSNYLSIYF